MSSREDPGQPAVPNAQSAHVLIVAYTTAHAGDGAEMLGRQGCRVSRADEQSRALAFVRDERPDLVVLEGDAASQDPDLLNVARTRAIPVLAVVDSVPEAAAWAERHGDASDWVLRSSARSELPVRAASLLRRRQTGKAGTPRPPADARFFSLVIHDLRTPLNVIGLSLRMIGQAVPKGDPDLDEDLRFVDENFRQIERMLAQLSDYFRLSDGDEPLYVAEFSPQTLLAEVLENRAVRSSPKGASVRLEVQRTCPVAVALDQVRARLALQHAVSNALAAAGEGAVVVSLRGEVGRWITEITTDRPPPASVQPTALRPHVFERLCGTAAERRGMDLAIAARVTEMFRGSARLDVVPNRGTSLVFDWPERLPETPAAGG